jgi:CRP/FNR family transcriptional regulator, cAMP and macrophage regulator
MANTSSAHAVWVASRLGRIGSTPLGADDDIAALVAALTENHYPAGSTLIQAGQVPARVHIIRSGAVELFRHVRGRRVIVEVLRSGDVLSDVPLFLRMSQPYDAAAVEDTLVLSIESLALHHLLEKRPHLARRWLLSTSAHCESVRARLLEILAGDLEAQIASVLVRHAEDGVVRLNQRILAELVGGQRTSVNRVLKRLEARKLVWLGYGQINVIDEDGLAAAAGLEDHGMRANHSSDSAALSTASASPASTNHSPTSRGSFTLAAEDPITR